MKKELKLTYIEQHADDGKGLLTLPLTLDLNSITRYQESLYYGNGHCFVGTGPHSGYHVVESYEQISKMIADLKETDVRLCYTVGGMQTRYIPKDIVAYVMASAETKCITLVTNAGEHIGTGMTMVELRKSAIEVNF